MEIAIVIAAAILGVILGRSLRKEKTTCMVVDLENLKASALAQIQHKAETLYSDATVSDDLFGKELADIRRKWRMIEK